MNIEEDLQAIKQLHQKDMEASKARNFAVLRLLMSDEAVVMPPSAPRIRGKAELDKNFSASGEREKQGTDEILDYVMDFEEVKVLGEYAFEWGTIHGSMRASPTAEVQKLTYNVMRILQKQRDGEWKVHRVIWNETPGTNEPG